MQRVIRVRTFCQPDTVVAKQILDSERLFELLDAPEGLWAILQNIKAFFKGILKREDMYLEHARESILTAPETPKAVESSQQWEHEAEVIQDATAGRRSPTKSSTRHSKLA